MFVGLIVFHLKWTSGSVPPLQVEAVKRVVSELKLTVVEMDASFGGATLEGSDILFTGREFFVGISSHTNRRGAEVLADTFRVRFSCRGFSSGMRDRERAQHLIEDP